jgi:hypothetical protein
VSATLIAEPALFPEDPTLDVVAPAKPSFTQETWSSSRQHCREWGLDPSREEAARQDINRLLGPRGITLPDTPRANHVVVGLGTFDRGVVQREPLIKLTVCTEDVAPAATYDVFAARLLADANAPRLDVSATPDLAWQRVHSPGRVEFGFRYRGLPEADRTRLVEAAEAAHDDTVRVHLRGEELWWTGLRRYHAHHG